MSAQTAIALLDGKATPVSHSFDPKGARTTADRVSTALWRDQSVPQAVGFLSLTETHRAVNSNGMEKFRYVIDVPTLETPASGGTYTPPPVRAYGSIAVVEFWVHERATEAEIKDLVAYVKNLAASAYLTNAVTKREPAW